MRARTLLAPLAFIRSQPEEVVAKNGSSQGYNEMQPYHQVVHLGIQVDSLGALYCNDGEIHLSGYVMQHRILAEQPPVAFFSGGCG